MITLQAKYGKNGLHTSKRQALKPRVTANLYAAVVAVVGSACMASREAWSVMSQEATNTVEDNMEHPLPQSLL